MSPGEAHAAHMPHWRLVTSQTLITQEVLDYSYPGSGTEQDPFVVDFLHEDARNPMHMPKSTKWLISVLMAFGTLS